MTVTINGKEYTLYFGLDFIDYIDKVYGLIQDGINVGQGLAIATVRLEMKDPVVLYHMIKAGTATEKSKPADKDVKEYVENEINFETAYDDFLSQLEKSRVTAPIMNSLSKLNELVNKKKKK